MAFFVAESTTSERKGLGTVEGSRVIESIRDQLLRIERPVVCGVGFVNKLHQCTLTHPEVFIEHGEVYYDPAPEIADGQACLGFFTNDQEEEKTFGESGGCVTYRVSGTKYMIAAMWLATEQQGNRFFVRCLRNKACDRDLYLELYDHSLKSTDSLLRDENGFRIQACMSDGAKTVFVIDCSTLLSRMESDDTVCGERSVKPVKGSELRSACDRLVEQCKESHCCVIGIENDISGGNFLGNFHSFGESGLLSVRPAQTIDPGMGCPMLFGKREFAPVGTSGLVSYEIGDTSYMLVVKWHVPVSDMMGENKLNVHILSRSTELSKDLAKEMEGDWVTCKQGPLQRTESHFRLEATMTPDEKAVLYVKISSE